MRLTNSDKIELMRLAVEIEKGKESKAILATYKDLLKRIDKKEADRLDSEIIPILEK